MVKRICRRTRGPSLIPTSLTVRKIRSLDSNLASHTRIPGQPLVTTSNKQHGANLFDDCPCGQETQN